MYQSMIAAAADGDYAGEARPQRGVRSAGDLDVWRRRMDDTRGLLQCLQM